MKQVCSTVALLAALSGCQAFVGPVARSTSSKNIVRASSKAATRLHMSAVEETIKRETELGETEEGPDTELFRRFGHLKGRDVKTVSQSMQEFCQAYQKPILPQYRAVVNDLLQSTHLSRVDARFNYDAVFGLGMRGIYYKLMKSYPGAGEADAIFNALLKALDLDADKMKSDEQHLLEWSKSTSETEILDALKGEGSSTLAGIAKTVRSDEYYLYCKLWGFGLIQMMETAGIEVTEARMESFIGTVGFEDSKEKALQDLLQYREVLDKTAAAEQLFKEIEIREKKKMADRLEEKAKRALEAAEKAEKQEAN